MPDISKESQTTGVTDKQETWKTRNKQNQKRFRDKQKEWPTARKLALLYSSAAAEYAVCLPQASRNLLQQEVHDMAERLQQLKAQKQELQSRGIMLERLLKTKHEQAKILQENMYKQADDHCLSTTQLLRQQSPVSWSNRRRQRQYIDSESQQGSHASLKASNTLNKPGLSSSSDRAPPSALALDSGRNRNRNTHTLSSDSSDPCSITALQSSNPFDLADPSFDWRNHQFWPLSAKPQAAATSPLDINQTYSAIVDGLKKLLRQLQAQGGMTHDLEHEFDCQTDAVGDLLKHHCLDNPKNYKKLLVVPLDPDLRAWETPDLTFRTMEHWQAVTEFVGMSEEQKRQLGTLRESFDQQRNSHMQQRQSICTSLLQAAEQSVPSSSQELHLSEDILKVRALGTSLQQHHQAWVQFYVQIFSQVWSSEQYARAVVASGPYHVDGLAIATCAAEEVKRCLARPTGTVQDAKSFSHPPMQLAAADAVF